MTLLNPFVRLEGAVRWPFDAPTQDAATAAPGGTPAVTLTQDAAAGDSVNSPYDSIWVGKDIPVQESTGVERILLSHDKLYTVLAVVLLIWFGIVVLLLRTDRKIAALERSLEERIAP